MGVITISMPDEDEMALRSLAEQKFGRVKGAISKTISEITKEKTEDSRIKKIWAELVESWEKHPIDLGGKKPYESRDELYDRY